MPLKTTFSDLAQRMGTGLAMAGLGLLAVWIGGGVFALTVAAICGLLVWELAGMLGATRDRAGQLGLATGAALLLGWFLPAGVALPLLLLAAIAGMAGMTAHRGLFVVFAAVILLAGFGLMFHRDAFGVVWMLWLVLVVGVTDVLGYFAGRLIGGPKFWPAVSPKKTWSGTAAGWVGAALIGALFTAFTEAGAELIGISVALSLASQMGDIAESAMKRRMGVKDSSNLLPGHGGLFDRFDGMVGAALMLLVVEAVTAFPPMAAA